ncbi:hypothetical protein [Lapidilactobacillus dextrinicus]|uniref:hypothetical protein n=1 Tax=Lapidilactobacillus dextrinicus TaxID=51664 RepID=UPI0022E7EE51|nr:hypothetical protein [Lapidilactobacillus dextrinicus]
MEQLLQEELHGNQATKRATLKAIRDMISRSQISKSQKKEFDRILENSPSSELLDIIGSKEVIDAIEGVQAKKYDHIIALKDTHVADFITLDGKKWEMKLDTFVDSDEKDHQLNGTYISVYHAKQDFLNKVGKMNSYVDRALELDEGTSNLISDIDSISEKQADKKFRYRFIEIPHDTTPYLRAVVDNERYKLYDNTLVLALAFLSLHNYCKSNKTMFEVSYLKVTDSKFILYAYEKTQRKISNNVYLNVGIQISNSEISDGSIKFNFTYRVSNGENSFKVISDPIITAAHGWSTTRINEELSKLSTFTNASNDIINGIKNINLNKKLDDEHLFTIFEKFLHVGRSPLNTVTRERIVELRETTANNTISLMELFSKIDDISEKAAIDARTYIESQINKLIRMLIAHSNS